MNRKSFCNCTVILFASLLWIAGCQKNTPPLSSDQASSKDSSERKVAYWTCSMHPQVRSDKPGDCDVCGMRLSPVYADQKKEAKHEASHAEVHLTEEGIRQADVRVEAAQERKLMKQLLIFGTMGYNMNLHRDVVSLVEGRMERQLIDFNQTEVQENDPLVILYSQQAIALQEDYLKALRERWLSTFYERALISSMVKLAEEKLQRIGFTEEDLKKLQESKKVNPEVTIRSPITGSVVGNMVHIGELAKADMPLYHIAPLDQLWFNAQVFEPDLGLLQLGQKVRITTKSSPGEEFIGNLVFIGRALEAGNRTVSVRFDVPNLERRLLPNLSANGQLEIFLGDHILSVPNSAVLDLGTRHVVYVQKEKGVYLPRNVRVGHVTDQYTQVLEGIKEDEFVVVSGAFLIDAQAQLRSLGDTEKMDRSTIPSKEHHH